jgi:hypothetical protein
LSNSLKLKVKSTFHNASKTSSHLQIQIIFLSSKNLDVVGGDFVIYDNNVISSSRGPFASLLLFSLDHFDTSNPNLDDDVVVMSLDYFFSTPDANLPNVPLVKKLTMIQIENSKSLGL